MKKSVFLSSEEEAIFFFQTKALMAWSLPIGLADAIRLKRRETEHSVSAQQFLCRL